MQTEDKTLRKIYTQCKDSYKDKSVGSFVYVLYDIIMPEIYAQRKQKKLLEGSSFVFILKIFYIRFSLTIGYRICSV